MIQINFLVELGGWGNEEHTRFIDFSVFGAGDGWSLEDL